MAEWNLEDLYSEWQNNLTFRKEFKKNPEIALKNAGFVVSTSDLEKIKTILQLSDEELDKKINK